jgi:hypothetical protein
MAACSGARPHLQWANQPGLRSDNGKGFYRLLKKSISVGGQGFNPAVSGSNSQERQASLQRSDRDG